MDTPALAALLANRTASPRTARSFRERSTVGEISVVAEVTAFFEEADRKRHLNIYVTEMQEIALERARQSDERIAEGRARPLDGLPIAVKDNYCTKGVRTTAASRILKNFVPTYESTVTQRLLDAGAIILGKTNMDEFAMGSSTESSYFGPTINPVGERLGLSNLVPGGSSGGSAAAVAANLALAALGTDTGGSIRQPASFCGVVGFKPTYGVCSRWGIIAYGSSLDQAGVLTRCVEDVAILMDVIAGFDPRDSTSHQQNSYDFEKALRGEPKKLRIGIAKEVIEAGSTPETKLIWETAERIAAQMGAEIVQVSIPTFKFALPAYYIIALSEASSNLARYDGVRYGFRVDNPDGITDLYERSRALGFGSEVKRRIMLGTYTLSAGYYDAYYLRAQKVRRKIADEFMAAFEQIDVMFMPTAPTAAFPIGAHSADPVTMYLEDIFTVPINMAGLPAVSIPVATNAAGLPLGLQLVGKPFTDPALIRAAAEVERAADQLI